jgi:hypothetical protein
MRCDDNHAWWRFLDGGAEPSEDELACPVDGVEAVTAARKPLADRARITLAPAAWERDGVSGFRDQYFLEVSPALGGETLRSADPMTWEDAVKRAGFFRDITWNDAVRRWSRLGLDRRRGGPVPDPA